MATLLNSFLIYFQCIILHKVIVFCLNAYSLLYCTDISTVVLISKINCFPAFATMYAEYKFVERVHERTGAVSPRLNKVSFAFGIISCVGMCLVATFQVFLVQPRTFYSIFYSIYLPLSNNIPKKIFKKMS